MNSSLVIMTCLSLFIVACKKEEVVNSKKSNNTFNYSQVSSVGPCNYDYITTTDSVGLVHNIGCDYTYQILYTAMQNNTLNSSSTFSQVMTVIQNGTPSFFTNSNIPYLTNNLQFCNDTWNYQYQNCQQIRDYVFNERPGKYTLWTPDAESHLSDSVKYYLDSLGTIYYDTSMSYNDATIQMQNLKSVVTCSQLNDEEKYIVLSAISVGISSMDYWGTNSGSWGALFNQGPLMKTTAPNGHGNQKVRNVGAMDIAATVGGAVTGGIMCAFGPVGIAGFFATTLGAGIGGSVTQAVYYLCGGN